MFYFMKNDNEITVKRRLESGGALSSVKGSWRCPDGRSVQNFCLFISGGQINSLQ